MQPVTSSPALNRSATTANEIGWANSGFCAGAEVKPMFDLLHGEHAVMIGGQFGYQF